MITLAQRAKDFCNFYYNYAKLQKVNVMTWNEALQAYANQFNISIVCLESAIALHMHRLGEMSSDEMSRNII